MLKCCPRYVSIFGKRGRGHRTGKSHFFIPISKKGMPKNVQTTIHLHSLHILTRLCSKSFKPVFEESDIKGRGTRHQIVNIHWIIEKAREFQNNIYFASLTVLKTLIVWITTNSNCGKF